jgi:hypothetical protein
MNDAIAVVWLLSVVFVAVVTLLIAVRDDWWQAITITAARLWNQLIDDLLHIED